MLIYNPEGQPVTCDKDQVEVLLKAGWSKTPPEKKGEEKITKDEISKMNLKQLQEFAEKAKIKIPDDKKLLESVKEFVLSQVE